MVDLPIHLFWRGYSDQRSALLDFDTMQPWNEVTLQVTGCVVTSKTYMNGCFLWLICMVKYTRQAVPWMLWGMV